MDRYPILIQNNEFPIRIPGMRMRGALAPSNPRNIDTELPSNHMDIRMACPVIANQLHM